MNNPEALENQSPTKSRKELTPQRMAESTGSDPIVTAFCVRKVSAGAGWWLRNQRTVWENHSRRKMRSGNFRGKKATEGGPLIVQVKSAKLSG